jgi:hypothetical protein
VGQQRPPLSDVIGEDPLRLDPALPHVYGQEENRDAPQRLRRRVKAVRARQPQQWDKGKTPWPQAPKDGKITYRGDGR